MANSIAGGGYRLFDKCLSICPVFLLYPVVAGGGKWGHPSCVATKLTFCGPSYTTVLLSFTVGVVTAGLVVPGGTVGTGIFDNGPPNRTNPFIFLFFVVCIHEKHFVRCGNFKTMSVIVGTWWQFEEPGTRCFCGRDVEQRGREGERERGREQGQNVSVTEGLLTKEVFYLSW